MKRWKTHLIIVAYLGALSVGIVCHTLDFGKTAHPGMYFLVWDMFGGWSSFSTRTHLIGEGEDGKYYELSPGPWGEFQPFGNIGRRHYDSLFNSTGRLARNTLRHTQHVPITYVFAVEECWSKKYNLPEPIWERRYDQQKPAVADIPRYYHLKSVSTPEGTLVANYPTWLSKQYALCVAKNPRLHAESSRGREFYALDPRDRTRRQPDAGKSAAPSREASAPSPLRKSAN